MRVHNASAEPESSPRPTSYLRTAISLSRAHAFAGFVAASLSIAGTVFGLHATRAPRTGDLLMFVNDRQTHQPVTDAIVEVLTPKDALVTTFPTLERTGARRALREGMYRVRVTNARFAPETRVVQVLGGQTSEVRFLLVPRTPMAPLAPVIVRRNGPTKPAGAKPAGAKPATTIAAVTKPVPRKSATTAKAATTKRGTHKPRSGAARAATGAGAVDVPRGLGRGAP